MIDLSVPFVSPPTAYHSSPSVDRRSAVGFEIDDCIVAADEAGSYDATVTSQLPRQSPDFHSDTTADRLRQTTPLLLRRVRTRLPPIPNSTLTSMPLSSPSKVADDCVVLVAQPEVSVNRVETYGDESTAVDCPMDVDAFVDDEELDAEVSRLLSGAQPEGDSHCHPDRDDVINADKRSLATVERCSSAVANVSMGALGGRHFDETSSNLASVMVGSHAELRRRYRPTCGAICRHRDGCQATRTDVNDGSRSSRPCLNFEKMQVVDS